MQERHFAAHQIDPHFPDTLDRAEYLFQRLHFIRAIHSCYVKNRLKVPSRFGIEGDALWSSFFRVMRMIIVAAFVAVLLGMIVFVFFGFVGMCAHEK
jgi:hypothetical protein